MKCPHCGKLNTAATDLSGDKKPYPGAASLCYTCCEWGVFDQDGETLFIRMPTATEQVELALDRDARAARLALIAYKRELN